MYGVIYVLESREIRNPSTSLGLSHKKPHTQGWYPAKLPALGRRCGEIADMSLISKNTLLRKERCRSSWWYRLHVVRMQKVSRPDPCTTKWRMFLRLPTRIVF